MKRYCHLHFNGVAVNKAKVRNLVLQYSLMSSFSDNCKYQNDTLCETLLLLIMELATGDTKMSAGADVCNFRRNLSVTEAHVSIRFKHSNMIKASAYQRLAKCAMQYQYLHAYLLIIKYNKGSHICLEHKYL